MQAASGGKADDLNDARRALEHLCVTLAPRELVLVQGVDQSLEVQAFEDWPDAARVMSGSKPARRPAPGLLVRLGGGQSAALWVGTNGVAQRSALDPVLPALLRRALGSGSSEGVRDAIHALRNALNGVSMSAAALATRGLASVEAELLADLRRSVGDGLRALSCLAERLPSTP
ncbi:hypothetical protein [Pseudomarimonas salicorniae]|uniref:Hpt domain-containing protein n=1 Tax=Pseudomarimonas salicorniae TaxID=2933270 RepID=A0ABT0GL60_9GAMM|nr:hypothetical protein [Lysobacter sp. CAU 1642]MCK7595240.1 hypothetical protein [Lysobacter sp. CAU 1642]